AMRRHLLALSALVIGACGSSATEPSETSGAPIRLVAQSAPSGSSGLQLCANHDIHVVDVQGDLRDIWAGRETAATGKQTSRTPTIGIRFDRVVDDAMLARALTLTGVTGSAGGVVTDCRTVQGMSSIDTVPIGTSDPIGTWAAGTVDSTSQRYLYDFQIFAT